MDVKLSNKEKRLITQYTIGAVVFGLLMIVYVNIVALKSFEFSNSDLPLIIQLHIDNPAIFFAWALKK